LGLFADAFRKGVAYEEEKALAVALADWLPLCAPLTLDHLSLLVDMHYLPFSFGRRAVQFQADLDWYT
jgi:hypothetical protein